MADDLAVFVVPDGRLARDAGLDLAAAGLRSVAPARHASVLLLLGPIPDALASAASVVYAQMPRPRSILAVGSAALPSLPEPDVVVAPEQEALRDGVHALRRAIVGGAFAPKATPFESTAARTRQEYVCPMHPEIVRDEPGSCPICGMDLVAREALAGSAGHDHAGHDHGGMAMAHQATPTETTDDAGPAYACPMHPEIVSSEPSRCPLCGMDLVPAAGAGVASDGESGHDMGSAAVGHARMDRTGMDDAAMDHPASTQDTGPAGMDQGAEGAGAMEHAAMGHDMGGGFMSMVAVTKDLPRSRDGLPMEWVDAPFGPLFPGLPGGLALTFTLDGDGVAAASTEWGLTRRGLDGTWTGPAATFPDRLVRLDPLSPAAYGLLGRRAVEAAAGIAASEAARHARIWHAEWERVRSHLGWLAEFAELIGDHALARRAASLHLDFARSGDGAALPRLARETRTLGDSVRADRLIRTRLRGVGGLAGSDLPRSGPVARAAGLAVDARLDDPDYRGLGFIPAVAEGDDALARLQVRLAEIAAGLHLLDAFPPPAAEAVEEAPADFSGTAAAVVETPRGASSLHLVVEHGEVVAVHLETPTDVNAALIPPATHEAEVADALVAVSSLDLSPWEHDR